LRDADALVPNGDADAVRERLDLDLDAAAVRRVLDRVVDQVDQHLAQPVRIGNDREVPVGAREVDHLAVAVGEDGAHLLDDLA
jgi:hypothetical protein